LKLYHSAEAMLKDKRPERLRPVWMENTHRIQQESREIEGQMGAGWVMVCDLLSALAVAAFIGCAIWLLVVLVRVTENPEYCRKKTEDFNRVGWEQIKRAGGPLPVEWRK
jgi:hypothetical protein